jgi:adenylate cyclase
MRLGGKLLRERNALVYDGLLKIALAEAERLAGDPDRAISIIDEALATCERADYGAFEAELHRVRGEMLLNRGRANPDAAELEFRSAVDIARRQRARSFGVRAALSLAKLRQSLNRPNDAHDVLAPALAGFSPTPEMVEIAEAQALVEELRAQARPAKC